MSIYNTVLARIAAESIEEFFPTVRYDGLNNRVDFLATIIRQRKNVIEKICDELFDVASKLSDDKERRKLINIKRFVFNKEHITYDDWKSINSMASAKAHKLYVLYLEIVSKEEQANCQLVQVFEEILSEDIEQLKQISTKQTFKNGLLLSSFELYHFPIEEATINKKNEKYLFAFYKYASRIIAKTSPFSTFTSLTLGSLSKTDKCIHFTGKNDKTTSAIRYNNYLLKHLYDLILTISFDNKEVIVVPNNTITIDSNKLLFFTNINNIDTFQSVVCTKSISYLLALFKESSYTFSDLVEHLSEVNTSLKKDEISSYLSQLISTGLLEFALPYSPLDVDFDSKIIKFLQQISFNIDGSLPAHFGSLLSLKRDFIDIGSRKDTLIKIKSTLDEICSILNKQIVQPAQNIVFNDNKDLLYNNFVFKQSHSVNELKYRNLLYEETVKNVTFTLDEDIAAHVVEAIRKFMFAFESLCSTNMENVLVTEFFQEAYIEGDSVVLLTFYQDYYKYLKTTENDSKRKKLVDAYNKVGVENEKKVKIIKDYLLNNNGEESVLISDSLLNTLIEETKRNDTTESRSKSHSGFIQLGRDGNKDIVIINGITIGYGKLMSRFLHLFDEKETEKLRVWNQNYAGVKLVENVDSSNFNANIHPPIFGHELKWPGNFSRTSRERQIDINDLKIRYNSGIKELEIIDLNGEVINVIDLGFQNVYGRSSLFQFLFHIGGTPMFNWFALIALFNTQLKKELLLRFFKKPVVFLPRIKIADNVFIQRKKWIFHAFDFKKEIKKMNDLDFFFFLQNLKGELNMPQEIFFRNELDGKYDVATRAAERKPQYVNLLSPLSVKLLHSIIIKSTCDNFSFEEMLPNSSQLLSINNKKTVTEFLLQWY